MTVVHSLARSAGSQSLATVAQGSHANPASAPSAAPAATIPNGMIAATAAATASHLSR
jgi:hypothetical protein